jgi:hypothetical protein
MACDRHDTNTVYGALSFGIIAKNDNIFDTDELRSIVIIFTHTSGRYSIELDHKTCQIVTKLSGITLSARELYKLLEAATVGARGFKLTIDRGQSNSNMALIIEWELVITTKRIRIPIKHDYDYVDLT